MIHLVGAKRKAHLLFSLLILSTLLVKLFGLFRIESMSVQGIGIWGLLINAGLMMLVIRGYHWARVTLGILMTTSAVSFLLSIFTISSNVWHSLILLFLLMVHGYTALFLLRDKSAKEFVKNQRARYDSN